MGTYPPLVKLRLVNPWTYMDLTHVVPGLQIWSYFELWVHLWFVQPWTHIDLICLNNVWRCPFLNETISQYYIEQHKLMLFFLFLSSSHFITLFNVFPCFLLYFFHLLLQVFSCFSKTNERKKSRNALYVNDQGGSVHNMSFSWWGQYKTKQFNKREEEVFTHHYGFGLFCPFSLISFVTCWSNLVITSLLVESSFSLRHCSKSLLDWSKSPSWW